MPVTVRPLSPALGAEIVGVDLTQAIEPQVFSVIHRAWLEYHLVLFRGQALTPEQQVAFCERFGPVSRQGENMKRGRDYMHISNAVEGGAFPNGELLFHSDHCFFESVMKGIALYGVDVPSAGGETLFANAERAYERLPAELKARIAGLRATHVHDYRHNQGSRRLTLEDIGPDAVRAEHPVVWPHPETGRPVLFVNELMTHDIGGLSAHESQALVAELLHYIKDPAVIYSHRWRLHDLVLWDNRSLQHARTNFDPNEKRTLRRVPIAETAGVGVRG